MADLVDCPACDGRGVYCLRANDQVWSELMANGKPCDFCNGKGKVTQDLALEYDPLAPAPYFPFKDQ